MLETVGLLVKPGPNARDIRLINKVRGSRMTPPINKLKFLVSHVITVAPNTPLRGNNTWAKIGAKRLRPRVIVPGSLRPTTAVCYALRGAKYNCIF